MNTFFLVVLIIVVIFLLGFLVLIIKSLELHSKYGLSHPMPLYVFKPITDFYHATGNVKWYRKMLNYDYLCNVIDIYHLYAKHSKVNILLGYAAIEESYLKLEYKPNCKNTHTVYTAYSIKLPERFKPYWKKSLRYATLNRRRKRATLLLEYNPL